MFYDEEKTKAGEVVAVAQKRLVAVQGLIYTDPGVAVTLMKHVSEDLETAAINLARRGKR